MQIYPSIKETKIVFLILIIFFIARIINHPPNFTPQITFVLFLGSMLSKVRALLVTTVLMILTDLFLLFSQGYNWDSWMIFTYSGLLAIVLLAPKLKSSGISLVLNSLIATLGYWIWTNFGTWLKSGMYTHDKAGLILCYVLALPFLENALLAALLWSCLLTKALKIIQAVPIISAIPHTKSSTL